MVAKYGVLGHSNFIVSFFCWLVDIWHLIALHPVSRLEEEYSRSMPLVDKSRKIQERVNLSQIFHVLRSAWSSRYDKQVKKKHDCEPNLSSVLSIGN